MDIRKLKQSASEAMAVARDPKKVILVYSVVLTLISLLLTLAQQWLDQQISGTGGLANMGIRSVLSTIQMVLPLVQSVVLLCWELGYLSAAMRFARKRYADHTDLRTGFRHFGPLLRMSLLEGFIYMGLFFVSTWIGSQIFMFTPFSQKLMEIITAKTEAGTLTTEALLADEAVMQVMYDAMLPLTVIVGLIFAVLALPVMYRYRMAHYRLLDKPQEGALAALRNSRAMMRGNAIGLFKLDLSFWWYYLLNGLAAVVCYGDQILPLLGVELPFSPMVGYFLFYGVYLVMQFGIYYFFRNRLEVIYVMAYETIRPQEQESGVVLGNIFDMQ